jgi:hypothetical protein
MEGTLASFCSFPTRHAQRAVQKLIEVSMYKSMTLNCRQLRPLMQHLLARDPQTRVHPTLHLALDEKETSEDEDVYDLSAFFTLMPELQTIYAPKLMLSCHELVVLTHRADLLTELTIGINLREKECVLACFRFERLSRLRKVEFRLQGAMRKWLHEDDNTIRRGVNLANVEDLRIVVDSFDAEPTFSWLSCWRCPNLRTFGIDYRNSRDPTAVAASLQAFLDTHISISVAIMYAPSPLMDRFLSMRMSATSMHLLGGISSNLTVLAHSSTVHTLVFHGKTKRAALSGFLRGVLDSATPGPIGALHTLKFCVRRSYRSNEGDGKSKKRPFLWKDLAVSDPDRAADFFDLLEIAERFEQRHGIRILDADDWAPPALSECQCYRTCAVEVDPTTPAFTQAGQLRESATSTARPRTLEAMLADWLAQNPRATTRSCATHFQEHLADGTRQWDFLDAMLRVATISGLDNLLVLRPGAISAHEPYLSD